MKAPFACSSCLDDIYFFTACVCFTSQPCRLVFLYARLVCTFQVELATLGIVPCQHLCIVPPRLALFAIYSFPSDRQAHSINWHESLALVLKQNLALAAIPVNWDISVNTSWLKRNALYIHVNKQTLHRWFLYSLSEWKNWEHLKCKYHVQMQLR